MRWLPFCHSPWQRLARRYRHQATLAWPAPLAERFATPLVSGAQPLYQQSVLALDFETSGLDPARDNIVSVGFVALRGGVVRLETARHLLVQSPPPLQDKAICLHHISPDMQRHGLLPEQALGQLWQALDSQIVLGHGTVVEQAFLGQYFQRHGLPAPALVWLDTLKIEQSLPCPWGREQAPPGYWQLAQVRRRYGLPDYPAHHALVDAVACAELLLAQIDRLYRGEAATAATVAALYNQSMS